MKFIINSIPSYKICFKLFRVSSSEGTAWFNTRKFPLLEASRTVKGNASDKEGQIYKFESVNKSKTAFLGKPIGNPISDVNAISFEFNPDLVPSFMIISLYLLDSISAEGKSQNTINIDLFVLRLIAPTNEAIFTWLIVYIFSFLLINNATYATVLLFYYLP